MATLDAVRGFVKSVVTRAPRPDIDTSFYFEKGLYGLYYPPRGTPNGVGIVVCNAFGKEFEIARTPLSVTCRDLAERGYACLRFDYGGYGDSAGEFEDATVTSMCDDIESALDELVRRSGVKRLGLLGMRFGATMAALVAGRRTDLERLILWEPLCRPWAALYANLRHTVVMQTTLSGKVSFTRDEIVANVLANRPSIAGGYNFNIIDEGFPLGSNFIREVREVDLIDRTPAINCSTLVMSVTKEAKPPSKDHIDLGAALKSSRVESAVVPCLPWVHEYVFATRFPTLFNTTATWLEA
jgi:pimeloyl-ACP methyl ester carboxylesterase